MSIVGPRPPIPYEVEAYELRHRKRLEMKPGLTDCGRCPAETVCLSKRWLKLDLFYIENWSVLFDSEDHPAHGAGHAAWRWLLNCKDAIH